MKEVKISYVFEYPDGKRVMSGGNAGYCVTPWVEPDKIKVGDEVTIVAFNYSGSFPGKAKVVGKKIVTVDFSRTWGNRVTSVTTEGKIEL